jgi:hypothetical protein
MILGMSVAAFTLFHVLLSLVGIGSGAVVVLVGREASPRVDGVVSNHHGYDQRDRVSVSFGKVRTAAHRRDHLAGGQALSAGGARAHDGLEPRTAAVWLSRTKAHQRPATQRHPERRNDARA